jgi:hypothetical protein
VGAPAEALTLEPWSSFARARQSIEAGDKQGAISTLQGILATPNLESRHYLQAFSALRQLGVDAPSQHAKDVLGVVVEVGVDKGLDLVAAYADHHARYFNYSGASVVWERPDARLDAAIDHLLSTAGPLAQAIGSWKGERPPAPRSGRARVNVLMPVGLHFGEGPLDALAKDRMGGPVITAAFQLMQELIKLTKK